jgi:hypothetical protein
MKKRILLVMGVMTILIFPTSVFAGHFSGISSVDGKEIRDEDEDRVEELVLPPPQFIVYNL